MRRTAQRLAVTSLLALTAVAAAPAAAGAAGAAGCAGADSAPAALGERGTARATLCLLNAERTARGLRALHADARLGLAARRHARDMVGRRYFAHRSKSGASFVARIKRTGWHRARSSWTVGENIGYGSPATPRSMVRGWMTSAGHRKNILARQFRAVGIGVALGSPDGGRGATYATDFGG